MTDPQNRPLSSTEHLWGTVPPVFDSRVEDADPQGQKSGQQQIIETSLLQRGVCFKELVFLRSHGFCGAAAVQWRLAAERSG